MLEERKRQAVPGQAPDLAARDAAQLILKQRRLSVASGTVTIPGSLITKISSANNSVCCSESGAVL